MKTKAGLMKLVIATLAIATVLASASLISSCATTNHSHHGDRTPAGKQIADASLPALVYVSYDSNDNPRITQYAPLEKWASYEPGGRLDLLQKMFWSQARMKSTAGIKHAACFYGDANEVKKHFFATKADFSQGVRVYETKRLIVAAGKSAVAETRASEDGMMLNIGFTGPLYHTAKKEDAVEFRLSHCRAGKMPVTPVNDQLEDTAFMQKHDELWKKAYKEWQGYSAKRGVANAGPASKKPRGFNIEDAPVVPAGMKLPKFELADKFSGEDSNPRPWKGLNINEPDQALMLALLLQKHIYEGMMDDPNPEFHFIAQKNKIRHWCHMPWLQVGARGREGIHGLTKELDLAPSLMKYYQNVLPGTDWGVAFYNAVACETIQQIFGTAHKPVEKPDFFGSTVFKDGAYTAKILFTSSKDKKFENAYTWNANVSQVGEDVRSIAPVRHIQMDVAIRDSSIEGSSKELNHWVMTTYYYDPDYDYENEYKDIIKRKNPVAELKNLPEGLKKMRPQGVQFGFEKEGSIIYHNAETNGFEGRLNGPADNPASSCLSCHGTAGTKTMMSPGFMDKDSYLKAKGPDPKDGKVRFLDFSQQIALAKRNLETELRKTTTKK